MPPTFPRAAFMTFSSACVNARPRIAISKTISRPSLSSFTCPSSFAILRSALVGMFNPLVRGPGSLKEHVLDGLPGRDHRQDVLGVRDDHVERSGERRVGEEGRF